jgi:hypothetical protein
VFVPHLASVAAGLDEAQLQPAGRLAKADKHCSGKIIATIAPSFATTLDIRHRPFGLPPEGLCGVNRSCAGGGRKFWPRSGIASRFWNSPDLVLDRFRALPLNAKNRGAESRS